MTENPFAPPTADMSVPLERGQGSLERAVRGDYEVEVGAIVAEAWELTKGAKLTFNMAALGMFFISTVANKLIVSATGLEAAPLLASGQYAKFFLYSIIPGLIALLVTAPLSAGLAKLGSQRAVNGEPQIGTLFRYFGQTAQFFALYLAITLMVYVGFALLILPGIFLAVAVSFAPYLAVDRGLKPFAAIAVSIKAVTHKWFAIFATMVVFGLLMLLGIVTVIGWIWTLPLMFIGLGVLYRTVFGVQNPELET